MAEPRQKIDASDKLLIGNLLLRIEAARRFPDNTDPSVRHVQLMGETLGAGLPYPMLDEERGHCAVSLLSVVAALYEARNMDGLNPRQRARKLALAQKAHRIKPNMPISWLWLLEWASGLESDIYDRGRQ